VHKIWTEQTAGNTEVTSSSIRGGYYRTPGHAPTACQFMCQ